jgi:rhodanese-related sulfurtransferase/CBS domain-containing protein
MPETPGGWLGAIVSGRRPRVVAVRIKPGVETAMRIVVAHEVERLASEGATVIDVLPREEYEEEHIAGAISIPLKTLDRGSVQGLDRGRPVVVYCWDALCDLSPRAAGWLEEIGFEDVCDYALGKVDWTARGLPTEGTNASVPRVTAALRTDVATCHPDEKLPAVAARVSDSPFGFALVTREDGTLLGRLRGDALNQPSVDGVAEAMSVGPSTIRADSELEALVERLESKDLRFAIVTDPSGRLLGVARRSDAQRLLEEREPVGPGAGHD